MAKNSWETGKGQPEQRRVMLDRIRQDILCFLSDLTFINKFHVKLPKCFKYRIALLFCEKRGMGKKYKQ